MYIHRSKKGGTPITSGFFARDGVVGKTILWRATLKKIEVMCRAEHVRSL